MDDICGTQCNTNWDRKIILCIQSWHDANLKISLFTLITTTRIRFQMKCCTQQTIEGKNCLGFATEFQRDVVSDQSHLTPVGWSKVVVFQCWTSIEVKRNPIRRNGKGSFSPGYMQVDILNVSLKIIFVVMENDSSFLHVPAIGWALLFFLSLSLVFWCHRTADKLAQRDDESFKSNKWTNT